MAYLASAVAGVLWLLAIVRILWPANAYLSLVLVGFLFALVILSLPSAARHTRFLCGTLGAAIIALAAGFDSWSAITEGLTKAAVFPAFLSTIVLLRATAAARHEIIATRRLFSALDRGRRDSGIVVGTHILGSILQVGVFAILAPLLARDAPEEDRRDVFVVAMRGMALVPLWSPFIVAMAVASQYLPQVPLWQIMSLGLAMAATGVVISFLLFDRGRDIAGLGRVLASLVPVAPPILVAAASVIATTSLTGLTTLDALVITLPVLCVLAVLRAPGGPVQVLRQTVGSLGRIGPEASILVFAVTLGVVFESALPATGLTGWLTRMDMSPMMVVFVIIMSINVTGLLGIHPVVTGTALLILFTSIPAGITDLVLMQAILAGWGLCTAVSISSLSVVTGAVLFRIHPMKLITLTNLCYVFLTSVVIGLLLTALDAVLRSHAL